MVNTPSTHHRKHVSKARAYKLAKRVSAPSTWARRRVKYKYVSVEAREHAKHMSTQARKHAKQASAQARQAGDLADSFLRY